VVWLWWVGVRAGCAQLAGRVVVVGGASWRGRGGLGGILFGMVQYSRQCRENYKPLKSRRLRRVWGDLRRRKSSGPGWTRIRLRVAGPSRTGSSLAPLALVEEVANCDHSCWRSSGFRAAVGASPSALCRAPRSPPVKGGDLVRFPILPSVMVKFQVADIQSVTRNSLELAPAQFCRAAACAWEVPC